MKKIQINSNKIAFKLLIFLTTAVIFAAGCTKVPVNVSLPENIDVSTLQVVSSQDQTDVPAEGNFTLTRADSRPFMVVVSSGDIPVAMTLVLPGREDNQVSCLDTAVALVLVQTGLATAPDKIKADLIDQVKSVTAVKAMANAICTALASDITAVANPDTELKNTLLGAEKEVINHLKLLYSQPG
jgi:hypothetical protein